MSTRDFSDIQEKRIADAIGGVVQPNSGALPIASKKADVRSRQSSNWRILLDGKTKTVKTYQSGVRSISVKKEWFDEIKKNAVQGGYDIGVMVVSFDNRKDYYMLEDVDFKNMYQALIEYEHQIEDLQSRIKELNSMLKTE
jgi:hypothetical protein